MLIYINDTKVQEKIKIEFCIKVPLYRVFDTKNRYFNSPLWFEMYRPDEEVIDNY